MGTPLIIFCAFTRRWAIDDWLANLAAVEHDPAQTSLCAIIDCDELYIKNMLTRFADERGYKAFHVKMNSDWHPNEMRLSIRRSRITEVHEQAKDLIAKCEGDVVIGLEDDTVFDRLESFDRLTGPIVAGEAGFVEGVQMGRWGASMIGAWLADNHEDPRQVETLLPPELKWAVAPSFENQEIPNNPYQEITAGGWYGYATLKRLFLDAPYFTSPSHPWGPDVEYGFWLRRRGQKCLVDWSTVFGHRDHNQTAYPDDEKVRLAKIIYNKNMATGRWERTDHEQTRY